MCSKKCIVLVTGGSGFIGQNVKVVIEQEKEDDPLVARNETWIFCSSKDGDLRDASQTESLIAKYKPTHVLHLAGNVGGLDFCIKNNITVFKDNLAMAENLLSVCHSAGVQKVMSCIPSSIFSDGVQYPADESMIYFGPPHDSKYGFSYSKRMIDVLNRGYSDKYGNNFVSLIACNVFGPLDEFNLDRSHIIPSLIRKMDDAILKGEDTVTVPGSGKPLRQFIYSRDLAKLLIWSIRNYNKSKPLILSVSEKDEISLSDVAKTVKKVIGYGGTIDYDGNQSDGQYRKTIANTKLMSLVKGFEFTPFEDAVRETVNWFQENRVTNIINNGILPLI